MSSRSRLQNQKKSTSLYIKHIPLLCIAIVCLIWILKVVTRRNPEEVANWGITQLYLPLISPFFLFTTFLFGYLTLNMRRGGVIGIFSTLLLLFRLQQIEFSLNWLIPFFVIFIVFLISSKKDESEKTQSKEKEAS